MKLRKRKHYNAQLYFFCHMLELADGGSVFGWSGYYRKCCFRSVRRDYRDRL